MKTSNTSLACSSLLLAAACACLPPALAATVTGTVQDTGLQGLATTVTFTPLSTPLARPPVVVQSSVRIVTTDVSGSFTVNLAPGDYRTTIGTNTHDSFLISVPEGNTTYSWTALATGVVTYHYPWSPAYISQAIAQTRGDLFVFNGTNVVRLAPGTNGQFLAANSATDAGLQWQTLTTNGLASIPFVLAQATNLHRLTFPILTNEAVCIYQAEFPEVTGLYIHDGEFQNGFKLYRHQTQPYSIFHGLTGSTIWAINGFGVQDAIFGLDTATTVFPADFLLAYMDDQDPPVYQQHHAYGYLTNVVVLHTNMVDWVKISPNAVLRPKPTGNLPVSPQTPAIWLEIPWQENTYYLPLYQ